MPPNMQPWAVVVPVKRLAVAKTRLALEPSVRADLALAMAMDTVAACIATEATVLVVTDDARAAVAVRGVGADVVADAPDAGLNAALRHGAQTLASRHPGARLVAVSSDLPSLTGATLAQVLARAEVPDLSCVADAGGTGTTVLAAASLRAFAPVFGDGSRQRHVDAGAVDLSAYADPRVRRDVDTLGDLAAACDLGCGPATAAVIAAHPQLLR